jgi:hypothetical protein
MTLRRCSTKKYQAGVGGFVPGRMYKSELKKGKPIPAYFGGCSSPFNQPVA